MSSVQLNRSLSAAAQTAAKVTQKEHQSTTAVDGHSVTPISSTEQAQLTAPVAATVHAVRVAVESGHWQESLAEHGEHVIGFAESPVSKIATATEMTESAIGIAKAVIPRAPEGDDGGDGPRPPIEVAESVTQMASTVVGVAEMAVKIVDSATSLPKDIKTWREHNEKLAEMQSAYMAQKTPLQEQIGSMKFKINGKEMTGIQALRVVRHSETLSSERASIISQMQNQPSGYSSISDVQAAAINRLGEMKHDKSMVESQAFQDKVKIVAKHTGVLGSIVGGVKKIVKAVGSAGSTVMSTVGSAVGLAANAVKMAFNARAVVRAGKSFVRSTESNPHVAAAKATGAVDSKRLDRLTKNIHRLARKKVVDKTVTAVTTGVAVAAGVVAVAVVAANPVGAALLGAGALVGVGYAVYKHVRAKRHAAKVETQHQQMNKTQQFFKSRIDRIDKEMKVSGADKGTILQREGFKTEAHFARLQKLSTSATFVLDASTLDSQDMNLVHQGCQSEIGAAKRAMATMTLNDHLSRSTEPDTTYNMLEARIQDYRDKMRSNPNQTLKSLGFSNHPGVGELNKAIFNQAKEELGKELAGFPDSADKIRHHVDDLMTRDERLIDDQFRQLYRDASTPEAKAEIVRYYSDVSVSQGQSGINERVLAMDSRDAASKFSAFRQFADIDNGKLQ